MAAMKSVVSGLGLMCALSLAGCFGPDAEGSPGGSGGSGACDCGELDCCDDECVNHGNDVLNCGSCGNVCPGPNAFCDHGVCGTPPCGSNAADRAAGSGGGGAGSGFAAGAGGAAGISGIGGTGGTGGTGAVGGSCAGDADAGAAAGAGGAGDSGDGFGAAPAGSGGFGGDPGIPAGSGGFGGTAGAGDPIAGSGGTGGSAGIGGTGGTCTSEPPVSELPPAQCCGPTACAEGQLCCWLSETVFVDPQCVTPVNGTCPAS